MLIAELVQQCLTLSLAQPPNAAATGDLELLHHGRGADLADTGQRLQQRGNLQLGNGFVVLGVVQNLLQGGTPRLSRPLSSARARRAAAAFSSAAARCSSVNGGTATSASFHLRCLIVNSRQRALCRRWLI